MPLKLLVFSIFVKTISTPINLPVLWHAAARTGTDLYICLSRKCNNNSKGFPGGTHMLRQMGKCRHTSPKRGGSHSQKLQGKNGKISRL